MACIPLDHLVIEVELEEYFPLLLLRFAFQHSIELSTCIVFLALPLSCIYRVHDPLAEEGFQYLSTAGIDDKLKFISEEGVSTSLAGI